MGVVQSAGMMEERVMFEMVLRVDAIDFRARKLSRIKLINLAISRYFCSFNNRTIIPQPRNRHGHLN
jgi:hypothetical protein